MEVSPGTWRFSNAKEYPWIWQNIELEVKGTVVDPESKTLRVIRYYNNEGEVVDYEVPIDPIIAAVELQGSTLHQGLIYMPNGFYTEDRSYSNYAAIVPITYGLPMVSEDLKDILAVIVQQLYDGYIEIKPTSTLISLLKPYLSMRI